MRYIAAIYNDRTFERTYRLSWDDEENLDAFENRVNVAFPEVEGWHVDYSVFERI